MKILYEILPCCRGRAAAKACLMPDNIVQYPSSWRSLPSLSGNELQLQNKEAHPKPSESPEETEEERKKYRGPAGWRQPPCPQPSSE